jgi:hypothetical protein
MLSEIQRYNENMLPSSVTPARGDRTGALVTVSGHSRYSEIVYQSNVWTLNTPNNGVTMIANNNLSANISTPIVGIWNPPQSKRIAAITRVITSWSNGSAPAGGLVWGFVPPMCSVTVAGNNSEINAGTLHTGGSPFKTFVNNQMTGVGNAQLLRLIGGPTAGSIGLNTNHTYTEECAGDIFCPPGAALGIFPILAGSNCVVFVSIVFEVIPQ